MKIALVNTWAGGAIYNVFHPLYLALKNRGVDVEWGYVRDGYIPPKDRDIIHFNYFANMARPTEGWRSLSQAKVTCSVHHMHPQHVSNYTRFIQVCAPSRIHTADPYCMRQLQQSGHHQVEVIPYTFDHTPYHPLPPPQEFTVGYVGCDYNTKRFDAIVEACQLAGVPHVGIARKTLNEEEDFLSHQHILDTYSKMSCYVVASHNDGGPLPPQEALLCGRPVATTHVGMMPSVIREGVNGTFHNGSPKDMAKAILRIRDNYSHYHKGALRTHLPTTDEVVDNWLAFFQHALEE